MERNSTERVVAVFAGGDPPPTQAARWIPSGAFVIAADSGLDHTHRLGFEADLLVGDLDSVSLDAADRHVGEVEQYPEGKDATDLELAMEAAMRVAGQVIVVGGHGGRLDHLLATASCWPITAGLRPGSCGWPGTTWRSSSAIRSLSAGDPGIWSR